MEVIAGAGAGAPLHPVRMKLAGRAEGELFDRLSVAQLELVRGAEGNERYLICTHTTLRRIAEAKPRSRDELARIGGLGDAKLERFAEAFLAAVADYR